MRVPGRFQRSRAVLQVIHSFSLSCARDVFLVSCFFAHSSRHRHRRRHHPQETFKAVILTPRASAADTATAAAARAASDLGTLPPAAFDAVAYSAEDELAADALAADLVRSLSELLGREQAAAAAAGGGGADAEAAAWSYVLEKLAEGPLGDGSGASDGQEMPLAAAAALEEKTRASPLFAEEPCDPRTTSSTTAGGGGREKKKGGGQERAWVSESRMLRGEPASSGGGAEKTAVGAAAAAAAAEGGRGGRTLLAGAPAAAAAAGQGGSLAAECAEAVGTVGEEDFLKIESKWLNVVLTMVCVVCAGLAAGLTMGLLSIEPLEMAIKQRSGK